MIMASTVLIIALIGFVICFAFLFFKYAAVQDVKWFCEHKIDRFPIESVYLLTKREVESFRFAFTARVSRSDNKQAIHDAIVRLKGYRGKVLQEAYDFAVN
jgi:hypothetical protein